MISDHESRITDLHNLQTTPDRAPSGACHAWRSWPRLSAPRCPGTGRRWRGRCRRRHPDPASDCRRPALRRPRCSRLPIRVDIAARSTPDWSRGARRGVRAVSRRPVRAADAVRSRSREDGGVADDVVILDDSASAIEGRRLARNDGSSDSSQSCGKGL